MFAKRGYSVVQASDGVEALQAMKQQQFDAVLMDLNMPRMGGLESIQQFRHWASTASSTGSDKRQFIIVVSANCTALHQQESLDSGADDFHAKPINMATLVATIEQRRLSTAGTSTTATAASTAAATATAGGDCETAASATAPRRRLSNILAAHTSLFSGSASSKSASHSPVAADQQQQQQQQQQQSQRRDSWAPTLSFHSLSNNSSSSSADKDV
eukprot:3073-Heterococcus_DN1.PRE.1